MTTRRTGGRGGRSRGRRVSAGSKRVTHAGSTKNAGPRKVSARRQPAKTSSAREQKLGASDVRLNKYLADHGVASRRGCDELIEAGKVIVDGMPVSRLGTKIDSTKNVVEVNGVVLRPEGAARRYYLLHKPSGVVCTNERRETRPRAIDLIQDREKGRIYTVGRLDEESTGLILLTNDGEFAQRVAHPRYGVPKPYRVTIQGRISDEAVQKVRDGVHLSDGRTGGARILVKRRTAKSSVLLITLREGKNREVRRVFARVGFNVSRLTRTDIGPLSVRGLGVRKWRPLSREEVEALLELANEERALEPLAPQTWKTSSTVQEGGSGGRKSAARSGTRRARRGATRPTTGARRARGTTRRRGAGARRGR